MYSYSRLATYDQCPYKHKLIYLDGNYIKCPSLATDFGTLIHSIEELIGNNIKAMIPIDYNQAIYNLSSGIEKIKADYPNEYYDLDKAGRTCDGKYHFYLRKGLHRLENRMTSCPSLKILGCEVEFKVEYRGLVFHGFIDRLLQDGDTYIIEDVKTYTRELGQKDLEAPLQFVIYALAIQEMYKTENIKCAYDLPLCDTIQEVSPNFMKKGIKKLDKLLDKLSSGDFEPKPSPLCHWCIFCKTYPNQPEEAKGLCPYYSLWTKENKTKDCHKVWLGPEGHEAIMEAFKNENDILE